MPFLVFVLALGLTQASEDARALDAARAFARRIDHSTRFTCSARMEGDIYPATWQRPREAPPAAAYQPCLTAHGAWFYLRFVREGTLFVYHDCLQFTSEVP